MTHQKTLSHSDYSKAILTMDNTELINERSSIASLISHTSIQRPFYQTRANIIHDEMIKRSLTTIN